MSSRVAAALPLLFALHCAEKVVPTDSMFDPDNSEGDYRLETQWSPGGDTICVFLPCTLHCSSAGDDELTGYRCSATPAGCMMPGKGNHDFSETPVLRFIAPGPCTLLVSGMRPNRVTVDSSYPLIIVNPFRIIVDSASLLTGDSVKFRVINTRCSTAADSALNVRWSVDGDSAGKPLLFDSHFVQAVVRPDTVSVSATINDPSGKGAVLDSARIAVPKKRIPSVIIDGELRASTDNSFTIVPSTTNADSLLWHIAGLINKDTVTTASPLSLTWSDSTDDTIIVIAKNRFGSIGASDTIYIQVRASAFVLDMIRFPGSVPARRMTFWEVVAKRGSEVIPDSEVTYRWTVTPDSAYDSIKIENGMLSLYFADDPGIPVIVSVDAIAGADTSLPSTRNVTVIADKPVLEIISLNDSIGLGDTSLIIIRTSDTNEGGSIVGKYCRVEGDSAAAMDSDTLRFVGRQPGEQTVDFWCVDNDGFSSAHITAHLLVTSINPYFLRSRDSITVYVNDPATIAVPARAGNAGGTITQWLWDFGADGSVDFTTSIDHLDTLFTEAGTITLRVGCRDNRGDSAETPAVRVITISTGAPFISLLTCSPDTVYRGDSVNVRIAASDPNGSVDTLLFGTDSLSPRRIALPHRAASTDTTIRCAMKATGSFRFAAAAVDDDGLRSAWYAADAATVVKKGNPTVTKITPDTCWMFDTARYTISASDPDGSVASYMIQWEQGGAWKTAADSTVGHSYSSSGTKLVRIVAIDNRGDMSDTLTDSVAVKFGRPAVSTDSFPDSAWINDMAGYTLSGSDPNGD
ncbi:MAG: hypothetical protein JXA18_17130, partial [Chitinispirillaceae bacterium]|nr:hypothetical protein [Chitinispirillaceae bacterium]